MLFYLDRPYRETEGYGVPFKWAKYKAMATSTKAVQGKSIVSIKAPRIRLSYFESMSSRGNG